MQTHSIERTSPKGGTPLIVNFDPPLRASATNTAITVNVPSFGTGNTNPAAGVYGWYQ